MNGEQIWSLDPQCNNPKVQVLAEDKTFEMLVRPLIASWPIQKFQEGMALGKRHFLTGFRISNKGIRDILTEGYRDYDMIIVQLMGTDLTGGFIDVVKFNSLQARTINHINNAFVARIPEYVTTASMVDYLEILLFVKFEQVWN